MACPTGKLVVKSKDPRINYNLLPGEELMTCPYMPSHAVLPIKFHRHVNNCHRLHCKEQQAKGEEPKFAICQYDRSHHVAKELLANHEANCKARLDVDDDWGNGNDEDAGAAAGACGGPYVAAAAVKVTLPKPPELSEEELAAIHTEDWDNEPGTSGRPFNPDDRIHDLRSSGYNYIDTHNIIGLTRSEKKEFYAKEERIMSSYERTGLMDRLKRDVSASQTTTPAASESDAASMYGDNQSMYSIPE